MELPKNVQAASATSQARINGWLAEIAKLLSKAEVRQRLLACTSAAEVVAALGELQGVTR